MTCENARLKSLLDERIGNAVVELKGCEVGATIRHVYRVQMKSWSLSWADYEHIRKHSIHFPISIWTKRSSSDRILCL
jgi:hypothetical protein